ncbi:MAG TPA: glycosyltransferase family 8 protein [Bdellovibrionota bacterium]|jgi:lipopolysaccharide biosynthesis glycosyltransferase
MWNPIRNLFSRPSPRRISVAYTPDSNYALPFTVSVLSLLEHYSFRFPLDIYVVGDQLCREDREKFLESIEKFRERGLCIFWIAADLDRLKSLRSEVHFSPIVYLRLLLPDLLDRNLERILYLDCDTVILSDITELYFAELGGQVLLASQDRLGWFDSPVVCLREHLDRLGIPSSDVYFNAGVLLFNLELWRREGLSRKILEFAQANPELLFLADQNAINVFFHRRIGQFDFSWNHQFVLKEILKGALDIRVLPDDGKKARIFHFVSGEKPWLQTCENPRRTVFFEYWKKTGWPLPDWAR